LPANQALPAEVRLQRAKRADLVIEGGRVVDPALAQALAMGWRADLSRAPASPWRLDGRAGRPTFDRPLFRVKRGAPVTLGFVNRTAFPQTTHVHGHVMRLLHPLDDGWEPYWRDSVMTSPGKTSRVAFVADNPGRWMIANADPDRAAAGLATWFEVE
jgi:FtsP/CotA-like multicopper oxidase with cupredoxin domain